MTWTTCQEWDCWTKNQHKKTLVVVDPLTQQHEWGPVGKLRGGRFLPTQQHSAHQTETAVTVRLALRIPQDVPLWLSSELPQALAAAVPQAPHEPQHRSAAPLHLGSHTQVVFAIRSLWRGCCILRINRSLSGEVDEGEMITKVGIQKSSPQSLWRCGHAELEFSQKHVLVLEHDRWGCLFHYNRSCFFTSSKCGSWDGFCKKAPLSNEKVTLGKHDFVDVGNSVVLKDLIVLVIKKRVLFWAQGVQQQVK